MDTPTGSNERRLITKLKALPVHVKFITGLVILQSIKLLILPWHLIPSVDGSTSGQIRLLYYTSEKMTRRFAQILSSGNWIFVHILLASLLNACLILMLAGHWEMRIKKHLPQAHFAFITTMLCNVVNAWGMRSPLAVLVNVTHVAILIVYAINKEWKGYFFWLNIGSIIEVCFIIWVSLNPWYD